MADNDRPVAIAVNHVSKVFKGSLGPQSFKQVFVDAGKKLVRKEEQKLEKSDYQALKDVDFDIKQGEFFGIVGRNGSGKSTLLKIIAGVYTPTKGEVIVNGKLTPFIELGVGFNPELTGRDNVYLNSALLGFTRKQVDAMYDEIVAFAELEEFMSMKLKNYSSGMQVRLAFSVAIRAKTEVLVVDEVLAVGDASFQHKCFDYFMELKKEKQTVVLVTHDMGAIRQYCDRAVLINDGRVTTSGTAEKVAQAYQKMFSASDEKALRKGEGKTTRWGTAKMLADLPDVKVTSETVYLTTAYEAQADLDAAVIGFSVYGPGGQNVLEWNTINAKKNITDLKKGQRITYEWAIPNIFNSGRYSVSVACCNKSATEFFDWVNNAGEFRIQKEFTTTGLVNPEIGVSAVQ